MPIDLADDHRRDHDHAATGATLLLITHDRSLAKRCGRIVNLADGRIVGAPAKRKVAAS